MFTFAKNTMANFLDVSPRQYNPYYAENPVEAMVTVGAKREEAFNQGIAKVQGYFDTIAGLDIAKDATKQYVTDKLNQVKKGITQNLAGDFSDARITNQIGGAATQIYKDPIVQNGVISTANYKKGLSDIEAARKAGKSDKNNEDYFANSANQWLSDGQNDTKFSDTYIPYTDIMKKIRENVSAAGLDSNYVEQMFETDTKGNILYDKNNHPIPSKVMTTVQQDTNLSKVKAIVANALSEGDVQAQLQVDGWANTRSTPVSNIFQTFTDDFNVREANTSEALMQIQVALDASSTTQAQRDALNEQKQELLLQQSGNQKSFEELKQEALTNPESFKQSYYKNGYVNNLVSAFSTNKIKKTNETSPLQTQLNFEKTMAFNQNKENWDRKIQQANYLLAAEDNQIARERLEAEFPINPATGRREKVDGKTTKKAVDPSVKLSSSNSGESVDALSSFEQSTTAIETKAVSLGVSLIHDFFSKINPGKNLTEAQTISSIKAYAKANGETFEQYVIRFSKDLGNKSVQNGIKLTPQTQQSIDNITDLSDQYTTRLLINENLDKQIFKETGISPKALKSSLPPVTMKIGGQQVVISPEDRFQYGLYTQYSSNLPATPEQKTLAKGAETYLKSKFGNNFMSIPNRGEPGYGEALAFNRVNNEFFAKNPKYTQALTKKSKLLSSVVNVSDNFAFGLDETTEDRTQAVSDIGALLLGTNRSGPNFDREKISQDLSDTKSKISVKAIPPLSEGQPWTGTVFVTNAKGEQRGINVNEEDLKQITKRDFKAYKESPLQLRINSSPFKSSNLGTYTTDTNAWQTAAISSKNFVAATQDVDLTVRGDVEPLPNGGYTLVVYAKDKTMPDFKAIHYPGIFNTIEDAERVIPTISPARIKQDLIK